MFTLESIARDCAPVSTEPRSCYVRPAPRPETEFLTGIQSIKGLGKVAPLVYGSARVARVGSNLNRLIREVRLLDKTETNNNGDKVIAHGKVKAFHGFAQVELTRSTKTGKLDWRFTMLVLDSWQNRHKVLPRTFKAQ